MRKLKVWSLRLAFCLIVTAGAIQAQPQRFDEQWRWAQFTTEEGLPSNRVFDVLETPAGVIWASTQNGVAWFNGYYWTATADEKGLPALRASAIVPASGNQILVLLKGQLYRGDEHGFKKIDIERDGQPLDGEFSMWSTNHEIALANLSLGKHSFLVQAKSLLGTYDSAGQHISFLIPNPYYLRPLFLLSMGILILGLVAVTTIFAVKERRFVSAISESEERYRCVVEHINDALMVDDVNGYVVYANDQFFRLFGFERKDLGQIKLEDYVAPEWRDLLRNRRDRRLRGETEPANFEFEGVRSDGQRLWLDVDAVLMTNSAGLVTGMQSVIRDITGRKTAEIELRRSQGYLGIVWESSLDGMRLTDAEGNVVLVNEAYCRLMEKPREALEGHLLHEAYNEGRRDSIIRRHRERFRNRSVPAHLEADTVLWNGERLSLEVSNSFLASFEDRPILLSVFRDVTERKLAREALQESEKRYREVVENANDIIYSTDLKGSFTHANAAALQSVGYTLEELRKFSYLDLILPDDRDKMRAMYVQQFRERRPSSYVEFPFTSGSGEVRWFGQNASLIVEGETIVGFQVIARDITERKQIEQELRRSRELFDLGGQLAKVGAWELDLEPQVLTWSEEVYSIHEVDPATRLNVAEAINFYAPEARPLILAAVQECIDSGTPWDLELPLITATGRRIWVRALGAAEVQSGRPVRLYGAFQDITRSRVANESLQLQSAALNAAASAMVITDRAGVIEWVNPAFTRLTGYTAAEAIGRTHRLLKSGQHEPAFYQELWKTVLSGQVWHGEITNRRKDGSLYTEDETITPVLDESGSIKHFVAIKEDISERLQLQTQFMQAQKMESVGRLAGGIAHDFNNLLTIINGNADLALMGMKQTDPLQASFQDIRRAGERAAGLTRQLLAFSRKQVIKPQELNLNTLIEELQRMIPRLIGEDIALVFVLAERLGMVKADPGQIEQVILNLAVNARDAMPNCGSLTIETRNVDLDEAFLARHPSTRPGPHVMLSITDTGTGMDAKTQAQIFEPFFTTKSIGKGTGLGLATVYGIIKQSGGSITVHSEVGQGTTFKVYLPQVEQAACEERPTADATAARGGETILVVEDEDVLRSLARRYIESAGYKVLDAANGREALRLLERFDEPVQLLLTDVVMPGMSGRELADRLLRIDPSLRVLFMSGYTDDAISHHGVLNEDVHFISKPFTILELNRAVRKVLDMASVARP